VAGARSFGDVALSCCGSHGRGQQMWLAAIGGGEKIMFGASWVVLKASGGDVHGWWWVGRTEWLCLVAK
jgi:hypothetical protein